MDRLSGTVKWFSAEKGYGFLERQDGEDVFVHRSSIEPEGLARLAPGDRVEFEIVPSEKGPRAARVTLIDAAKAGRDAESKLEEELADRSRPAEPASTRDGPETLDAQLERRIGRRFLR